MGKEVERKWVLRELPQFPTELEVVEEAIVQAYLIMLTGELRIRQQGNHHLLTVKGDGTISRDEWNAADMPQWAFELLLPYTKGKIFKTRYTVADNLEFDVYDGELEGLVVLEVEFGGEEAAAAFVPPSWCDVVAEVTEDARFKNKNLALAETIPEL